MKLPTEIFGNVAVVHTPSEFGEDQLPSFRECVGKLGLSNIVVDLDGTELIDSEALTELLDTDERLQVAGGRLKIATANAMNRRIFEITRLDQYLEVFDGVVEAVRSFRRGL
ncbi:MAG: anti-sigma factor antagonist [Planctomycetota bacterium]|nr:MAG: anti-sigma factor antagonist [Planctomycetota bacterium]